MKKGLIIVGFILLFFFLQIGFFTNIAINQIKPNFLVIAITLIAFLRGEYYGLTFGAPLGLLLDIYFGPFIGLNFFLYSCIGLLAGKTYYVFSKENFMFPLLVIGLADISYNGILYIIGFLFRGNLNFFHFLVHIILPDMIYTVLLAAIIYRPFVWLNQLLLNWESKYEENDWR